MWGSRASPGHPAQRHERTATTDPSPIWGRPGLRPGRRTPQLSQPGGKLLGAGPLGSRRYRLAGVLGNSGRSTAVHGINPSGLGRVGWRTVVARSRSGNSRSSEIVWRVFALVAALLVVGAALMPEDARGIGSIVVRWLGAAILLTVVYSYVASLRRR